MTYITKKRIINTWRVGIINLKSISKNTKRIAKNCSLIKWPSRQTSLSVDPMSNNSKISWCVTNEERNSRKKKDCKFLKNKMSLHLIQWCLKAWNRRCRHRWVNRRISSRAWILEPRIRRMGVKGVWCSRKAIIWSKTKLLMLSFWKNACWW